MGDVLVENPANHVLPQQKALPSTIPNIETFEGLPPDGGDEYATLKKLQRQLEYATLLSQALVSVLDEAGRALELTSI
jgi:26S proteasome regulatory subunit T3